MNIPEEAVTAADLHALTKGSVILDNKGQAWQKVADDYWHAALWKMGSTAETLAANLLPARVIYRKERP